MQDNLPLGEELLRSWLCLTAVIWNRDLVSGLTYNEAVVSNLLTHQMATDPTHPLTATDLCEKINVQKSQMNQILGSLERRGYLERHRSESDRRQVLLALTPQGQQAYALSHQIAQTLLSAVGERLGPEGMESLSNYLQIANATVQETLSAQRQKGTL